jgi:hypothetical protein
LLPQNVLPVMRAHPITWIVPLLLTLLVAAVGTTGVILAARWDEAQQRTLADGEYIAFSWYPRLSLQQAFALLHVQHLIRSFGPLSVHDTAFDVRLFQTAGFGDSTAIGIHVTVQSVIAPMLALVTQILETPPVAATPAWFGRDAKRLLNSVSCS